jgi:tyrosinase
MHSFTFLFVLSTLAILSISGLFADAFAITGVTGGVIANGPRPARRDIVEFQRNGGAGWDLYILSLQKMQAANQSDPLSYYQIAGELSSQLWDYHDRIIQDVYQWLGIHGRPFIPWDGASNAPPAQNWYTGYCTHSSVLFPTWHRPYLALYEVTTLCFLLLSLLISDK